MEPEYLSLFSDTGNITVEVRFRSFDGSIREKRMQPTEIGKLVQPDQDGFVSHIYFDEHRMKLERIEILVDQRRMVLHVVPSIQPLEEPETPMTDHNIWIGSAYQTSSPRVLILGESDYGGTDRLERYVPQWLEGAPRDPTFSRISNSFAASLPRDQFWQEIAFYNFVPGMVGATRKERPTKAMYVQAQVVLPEVLRIIKPDGVLILGKEQSEYSQPVLHELGIAHTISPHPAAWGITNEQLTFAWNDLMKMLEARG